MGNRQFKFLSGTQDFGRASKFKNFHQFS